MKKKLQKEIERIKKQIIKKYKPEKIILFGRAAEGKFGKDSDLDFLIIKEDTPYWGIERIRELRKLIKKMFRQIFLSIVRKSLKNVFEWEIPLSKKF
jgi:predicted nucleotidyltransferase